MASIRNYGFRADAGTTRITSAMQGSSPASYLAATATARLGMAGIVKNYLAFASYIQDATPDILLVALRDPFQLSQVYVPRKTGKLAASGYLIITKRGRKPQVEIGYGRNNDPDYAGLQHENLEFRHDPPTRAKYLQRALEERTMYVWADIQNMLAQAAASGINPASIRAKQIIPAGVRVR